jgi:beta-glucosidase
MLSYQFPTDFIWGVATSAYQIEGAVAADGRKPSVWDRFCSQRNRILKGHTGAIACDHYHRYPQDVKLIADLGVKHYRFSLSWPRIVPDGRGAVNEAGVDFYRRLVDCLLEAGITPHATLFHWDSPQALEDRYGSWRSREMASDFADYVAAVVERLGDRITHWMTLNEIFCFTHLSYAVGTTPPHAPGTRVKTRQAIWQTSHHALLAHGLACQAIRAHSPGSCHISLVDNPTIPVPLMETAAHIEAARRAFPLCSCNGGILMPALSGTYSPDLLAQLGPDAPNVQAGDLEIIHQPLDAIGLNLYTGTYVRAANNPQGFELLELSPHYPRLHMPWLWIVPETLYWGVRHLSETLDRSDLPVWITENGCAAVDQVTTAGEVVDPERILYLRQYLKAAHRAVAEGYPLQGYFAWSLMDNFEWAWGYDRRFGLIYVDYPSQTRIPKASYHWYAECIRQNRVV